MRHVRTRWRWLLAAAAVSAVVLTNVAPADAEIIGSDERIRVYPTNVTPARWVAWVYNADLAGQRCSGFLVDRNSIVTSAHCLTDPGSPWLPDPNRIIVILGLNGTIGEYGFCSATSFWLPPIFHTVGATSAETNANDYAVINLSCTMPATHGAFGLWVANTPTGSRSATINGYPVDKAPNGLFQWKSFGETFPGSAGWNATHVAYNNDTEHGMSGAPVYLNLTGSSGCSGMCVYAIHAGTPTATAGFNWGVRITTTVKNRIMAAAA